MTDFNKKIPYSEFGTHTQTKTSAYNEQPRIQNRTVQNGLDSRVSSRVVSLIFSLSKFFQKFVRADFRAEFFGVLRFNFNLGPN